MSIDLTYTISTGLLDQPGSLGWPIVKGYSGRGAALNNPAMCDVPDVGPLPIGAYTVNAPIDPAGHLGPLAFPLIPDAANQMHGRDGFYIHGDNVEMNHSASCGCIILPRVDRVWIARLVPARLTVVA
jgi:hypothetical protein